MSDSPKYKRLLLKLSGEALMGDDEYGINMETTRQYASEIATAAKKGVEIAIVVGGGNIFRGMTGAAKGMDRASADYMGMLATVMNGLGLQGVLKEFDIDVVVMSAIPMPTVCEPYVRHHALDHLKNGRIVIFVGGTGNPYFTTDTASTLRAIEMNCDCLAKATQVDGVYSADPKKVFESAKDFMDKKEGRAIGFLGNVVDLLAYAVEHNIDIHLLLYILFSWD